MKTKLLQPFDNGLVRQHTWMVCPQIQHLMFKLHWPGCSWADRCAGSEEGEAQSGAQGHGAGG